MFLISGAGKMQDCSYLAQRKQESGNESDWKYDTGTEQLLYTLIHTECCLMSHGDSGRLLPNGWIFL